ncbi:DASH complex subunit Dad3 [Colletotrichum higginsianum]|uniref:DASH complex subunit DAD3 n=3 Tax=Colletotrichum destructivum species complex TaxID=2707350 RepID=H1W1G5_COLHI|nr:DASH complex subunit Dad3 [Colletotrichum higginsianum IMI 349063]OBR06075.1 DASH complex subunit Dad3 [Colletotrichum higginsianum IMI 349063]TIC97129.1 DASH complex subunit DAD3 [Colletotrichum higginsianum]GJD01677.1 DASH complex subunit Dad3 [Colletotrichum higginsianum]CCF46328.1 DASH complex subunit Dad3 [Colletotrichum higginsianum]
MEQGRESTLLHSQPELTPLEAEVLEEYEKLADNMKKLASTLEDLSSSPSTEILDGLRELERKTSLVFTLLKASVYSIVLQQEIDWGDRAGSQGDDREDEEE